MREFFSKVNLFIGCILSTFGVVVVFVVIILVFIPTLIWSLCTDCITLKEILDIYFIGEDSLYENLNDQLIELWS